MNQVLPCPKQVFLASAVNCVPATPIKSLGVYIARPICTPQEVVVAQQEITPVPCDVNTSGLELLSQVLTQDVQPTIPAVVSVINLKFDIRTFVDAQNCLWIVMCDLDPYVCHSSLSRFKYRLLLKDNTEQRMASVPHHDSTTERTVNKQCLTYKATLLYLELHGKKNISTLLEWLKFKQERINPTD